MMTMTNKLVFASVFALLATGTVLASDIYKYTDENGVVHYVDRPTGAPSEERVDVVVSNPSPSAAANSSSDWRARRDARKEAQSAAKAEKSEKEERAQLCQQYRDRLVQYDNSRQLYRMDEQGERVYLNDKEIEEARQQVQAQIDANC